MKTALKSAWHARMRLYAVAQKLQRQADFSSRKIGQLNMDDHRNRILYLKDLSMNQRRDAFDRIQEADLLWERAVKEAGRKVLGWLNPDVKKGSYECHLDDGQIFRP